MVDLDAILRQKDNSENRGTFDVGQAREPRRSRPLQLSADYASANNEPTINNQRSMLASGDMALCRSTAFRVACSASRFLLEALTALGCSMSVCRCSLASNTVT
jgi:hypothetical protein